MCGIAGFRQLGNMRSASDLLSIAERMGGTLAHRGPDAQSTWHDAKAGIALAHRRLAIVDLSEAGAQPMTSASGKFTIAYNGEIYNFKEVRQELEKTGIQFRGHSDTEVLLEACERWGVYEAIKKFIGMFAFAIWDASKKSLYLCRDRVGIKPLYWYQSADTFMFGSELRALKAHPDFSDNLNHDAIASFMRHNYVPGEMSIYKDVHKVPPGHILEKNQRGDVSVKPFWSMSTVVSDGQKNPYEGGDDEAIDHLEQLLADSVKRRMVSDVSLGAFLSGGIDSSVVVALMQKQSDRPVKTFSIGFQEASFNESDHATSVASHLGTEHCNLMVSEKMALDLVPIMSEVYDEPFSDSSQIPTYLLSKLTREHVTVALSGDGGDELFAGYTRYSQAEQYAKILLRQPAILRKMEAGFIESISPATWNILTKFLPSKFRTVLSGDKLVRLPNVLKTGDSSVLYRSMVSHADYPNDLLLYGQEPTSSIWQGDNGPEHRDFLSKMQYLDTLTYLPDDILTKVDRASMAVSLEARVPILDHRVVEYAWRLPHEMKVRNADEKWLLKQVLYRHVPKKLVDRPKMGFGIPLGDWITGALMEWSEDLLTESSLKKTDVFNVKAIRQKWEQHKSGQVNWQYHIWDVLMMQSWLLRQMQGPNATRT